MNESTIETSVPSPRSPGGRLSPSRSGIPQLFKRRNQFNLTQLSLNTSSADDTSVSPSPSPSLGMIESEFDSESSIACSLISSARSLDMRTQIDVKALSLLFDSKERSKSISSRGVNDDEAASKLSDKIRSVTNKCFGHMSIQGFGDSTQNTPSGSISQRSLSFHTRPQTISPRKIDLNDYKRLSDANIKEKLRLEREELMKERKKQNKDKLRQALFSKDGGDRDERDSPDKPFSDRSTDNELSEQEQLHLDLRELEIIEKEIFKTRSSFKRRSIDTVSSMHQLSLYSFTDTGTDGGIDDHYGLQELDLADSELVMESHMEAVERDLDKRRLELLEKFRLERERYEKLNGGPKQWDDGDDTVRSHDSGSITVSRNVRKPNSVIADRERVLSERDRLDKERAEKERLVRVERDRIRKEKVVREKQEKERLEKEKLEAEKLEKERRERDRLERERLKKERLERERLERDRLEKEKVKRLKLEQERQEKSRLEKERLEKERADKDRLKRHFLEKERLEKERLEKERLEKERLEKERLERERLEKERLEKERLERELQQEKDEVMQMFWEEKLVRDYVEWERLESIRLEQERQRLEAIRLEDARKRLEEERKALIAEKELIEAEKKRLEDKKYKRHPDTPVKKERRSETPTKLNLKADDTRMSATGGSVTRKGSASKAWH